MRCNCTLPIILERYRDLLAADVLLSADGGALAAGASEREREQPRQSRHGRCRAHRVTRPHSGRYGGPVGNAATVLARNLAPPHDHGNGIPEFAEIGRLLARIFQAGPGAPKDAMVANRFADAAAAHPVPSFVE
jgi:hypothetical protein